MSCFVAGDANEGTVLSEVGLESGTREVAMVGTSRNKCPVCAALGLFRFGCSVDWRNNHGISSSWTLTLYTQICLSHPPVVESSFYLTCLFMRRQGRRLPPLCPVFELALRYFMLITTFKRVVLLLFPIECVEEKKNAATRIYAVG